MSAKGGNSTGNAANVENVVETSPESAKIEMTDTANSEALQDERLNVVKSETEGEMNRLENQSLEEEEMGDEVNLARIVRLVNVKL